ncbi:MAG: hypothetical protein JST11_23270 [Acidobacteria bacterium]|nr:hypothetical protein [Acidobacteriota bacterium]
MQTKKPKKATLKKSAKQAEVTNDLAEHKPLTADVLPRRSLEQALDVAKILRQVFAGKAVTFDELAKAMDISRHNPNFKYTVWSAVSYGIVNAEGPNQSRRYSLAETGRKIVAENIPGEGQEARIKAVLTPTVLSKFYTDYNGHPIPPTEEHFANVLEDRFNVPRDRTKEAMDIIVANGKYAGIFEETGEGQPPVVRVTDVPTGELPTAVDHKAVSAPEAATGSTAWEKICFYITPLGEDGSEERRHANMMLNHVVRPVFKEHGFTVVRADEIAKTGLITRQIFEHLAKAKICVADLSFHNPNAFYELGVRHAFLLPTIQLIHKSRKIPFDLSQGRTITIDTSDSYMVPDHLESARKTLAEYVKNMIAGSAGPEDNPVAAYLPGVHVTMK